MKIKIILIVITFLAIRSLISAPGCMDDSHHMQQRADSKDYYYVACNCPCQKRYTVLDKQHGKCVECQHYREPQSFIIVTQK